MGRLIKRNIKLKSSSLIETIVAMMIILSVFGIAMMIYINVIQAGITISNLQASLQLNEIARQTKLNKSYFDETIESETLTIQKKISRYNNTENLIQLDLQAENKSRQLLAKRREIILKDIHD